MSRTPHARQWRIQQLATTQAAERDVLRVLEQARRDIRLQLRGLDKDTISHRLRVQQIRHIQAIIAREQARIWRDLGQIIRARRLEAAARVITLGAEFDTFLFRQIGGLHASKSDIARLIATEERTVASSMDRMMARVLGQSYHPLSDKVYTSRAWIDGVLDRKVSSALARGLSAREFAAELSGYIDPLTPGGIRFASMRLARSEINNAAHAVAINNSQGKPWISGMQWSLSASHPKPDECDDLADGGVGGNGVYDVDKVPAKPHPQCFCIVTPVSVSDSQFLTNLLGGYYDDYASQYLDAA